MRGPRESDELTLDMVRLRSRGYTPTEIAEAFGMSRQYVSVATNRVMRADVAESGEDVNGSYWRER